MSHLEEVVLVDEHDTVLGTVEKITAHKEALLHRAFSVFLFRDSSNGWELLLQKRSSDKYHCGGLWTNTCCSHPRLHEDILAAGQRRLVEELGIKAPLKHLGGFVYKTLFDNGLTEHEWDHVLVGLYQEQPTDFNRDEVEELAWVSLVQLQKDLIDFPQHYTPWLPLALAYAMEHPEGLNRLKDS